MRRGNCARAPEPPLAVEEPQPEFTLRAVSVGLLIGVLLCFVNTYFGLQSGWVSMQSLQSALLGYAVFKVLPGAGAHFFKRPLSVHENVVIQTTAVATGTLPLAAGLVGVIPALALLDPALDGSPAIVLSPLHLLLWCFAVAFFGVFLAVPLRQQVIVKEKLVFPSGTATAQIIGVLHGVETQHEDTRRRKDYRRVGGEEGEEEPVTPAGKEGKIDRSEWRALSVSFAISAAFTLVSLAFPVLYALPVFDLIVPSAAHSYLWWFTPSFSYIGQGIIMGPSTVAAMNVGMVLGWAFLSPLSMRMGWATGEIGGAKGAKAWILWPALAILLAESLVSIATVGFTTLANTGNGFEADEEPQDEPSTSLVVGGVIGSSILCVVLIAYLFGSDGIRWWATVIAIVLGGAFSILGVRALGETDLNPVSAIGKISQVIFAIVQPHNVVANLIAGGIAEAGANQAGDLMQDLKTGHLLGASPRAQFYGQLVGSFASVFVSSGIYILYRRVYDLPSTSFPVPSAAIWLNLARLMNNGALPPRSQEFMVLFGAVFLLLAGIKAIANLPSRSGSNSLRWTKWIPSGIAVGIGFINTPSFSIARGIGGLISLYFSLRHSSASSSSTPSHLKNIWLIIVASGLVLGEGAAAIVGLAIKTGGGGAISCFGCNVGGGGYCPGCP